MSLSLPAIEEYDKLIPVARSLYEHTSSLSWQMLLPLFLLSVAIGYSTELGITGTIVVRLKRLVLVALLLVAFPTIAEFCQIIGVEIAKSIDDMTGIDMILDAAAKKADGYSFDLQSLLNFGNDFVMAILVTFSFIVLVAARFFLLAFQHFYWLLLVALGPFLILATLFESASGITKGLFKTMFQISCWPIIWSILSAFLKALPFAPAYALDPNRITVVTLNFIIAVALLLSPFIVSQLSEGVSLSVGDTLRRGVMKTLTMAGPKGAVGKVIAGATAAKAGRNFNR